jgi:hypothetical protein
MRTRILAAVIAGGLAIATLASLPPATMRLSDARIARPVRGAFHVHTSRSDGSGSIEQVAAAAARSGLDFVILTDHGDATRRPSIPRYLSGVLCIDAVEISSSGGHLVALDLPGPAPYPLGGETRDVIEDVHRQGGMVIAAHPDSRKDALRWRDWTARIDGLEWLNADSEWRDEHPLALARALLTYPWRRAETLAAMLNNPSPVLERWDSLARDRRVVAIAGADAHANLGLGASHPYGDQTWLAVPAYEQSFRTFSIAVPKVTLTRNPDVDAAAVIGAVREGRVYSSLDALAGPARFDMTATSDAGVATPGDEIAPGGPIRFDVRSTAPAGSETILYRDGQELTRAPGRDLTFTAPGGAGAYRAEVRLPGNDGVPWIVGNPVYVGRPSPPHQDLPPAPRETRARHTGLPVGPLGSGWGVEKSSDALGELDVVRTLTGTRLRLRYALAGSTAGGSYVALGMPAGEDLAQFDRVIFAGQADRPMRIWFQLWMPVPTGNNYWRRSIYLDENVRDIAVPLAELIPVGSSPERTPLGDIQSLMFVVDEVHTPLGQSGTFWIGNVRYAR